MRKVWLTSIQVWVSSQGPSRRSNWGNSLRRYWPSSTGLGVFNRAMVRLHSWLGKTICGRGYDTGRLSIVNGIMRRLSLGHFKANKASADVDICLSFAPSATSPTWGIDPNSKCSRPGHQEMTLSTSSSDIIVGSVRSSEKWRRDLSLDRICNVSKCIEVAVESVAWILWVAPEGIDIGCSGIS